MGDLVTQYIISEDLRNKIKNTLQEKNMSLEDLCKKFDLDFYMTNKVVDENIKMHAFKGFFVKLERCVNSLIED